jgi:membrane protein implicated in regulation of membrane protease activity
MQSIWWFVAAMLLGVIEIFTLDLMLVMLAGGALAAGVAALVGAPLWASIVVFCVVSALLLFALRPYLLKALRSRGEVIETNAAALVGRGARAIDDISETAGRVKLAGEVWTARIAGDAEVIPEGSSVTVVAIKGATAIVAPEKG